MTPRYRHCVERYDGAREFFADWLDVMSDDGWRYLGPAPTQTEADAFVFRKRVAPADALGEAEARVWEETRRAMEGKR